MPITIPKCYSDVYVCGMYLWRPIKMSEKGGFSLAPVDFVRADRRGFGFPRNEDAFTLRCNPTGLCGIFEPEVYTDYRSPGIVVFLREPPINPYWTALEVVRTNGNCNTPGFNPAGCAIYAQETQAYDIEDFLHFRAKMYQQWSEAGGKNACFDDRRFVAMNTWPDEIRRTNVRLVVDMQDGRTPVQCEHLMDERKVPPLMDSGEFKPVKCGPDDSAMGE